MAAKNNHIRYTDLMLDWKERPTIEQLNKCLNKFGVFISEDESLDGSDMYGFLFTDRKVSQTKLNEQLAFDRDCDYEDGKFIRWRSFSFAGAVCNEHYDPKVHKGPDTRGD